MTGTRAIFFASLVFISLGVATLLSGCENLAPDQADVPDGFLVKGCNTVTDCDDSDLCTLDECISSQCQHSTVDCKDKEDECNTATCMPRTGCRAVPANEGGDCTTIDNLPGACMQGACTEVPQCHQKVAAPVNCGIVAIYEDTTHAAPILDTYSCASGETGGEIGFPLMFQNDRDVTLTLNGGTTNDLDLIVLQGSQCTAGAKCAAQSITAGTGQESATFHASAHQQYVVVVEGQNGAVGAFNLKSDCASCKPIKTLACNMTITGDTTGPDSTNVLPNYGCNPNASGPEDTYKLPVDLTRDVDYRLTLSHMSTDLDLMVVGEDKTACDNSNCQQFSVTPGLVDEVANLTVKKGLPLDVVIDSSGAGGPYQLEVYCPPSCSVHPQGITCNKPNGSGRNDDATKSTKQIDSWPCDANTTGSEVVYVFSPATSGMYTFELSGLTADLDLIVVQGTPTSCDPSVACLASSVTAGNANESVTFQADVGKFYYIAVDGKNGAASAYKLKMSSTLCPAPSCVGKGGGMSCNFRYDTRRSDDAALSSSSIDNWACDANTTGNEVIYKFKPTVDGNYTFTLDGLTADLDLIVVAGGAAASCDSAAACLTSSIHSGTTAESVTFHASPNTTYFVAVDGKNGAVGDYKLTLTSPDCGAPTCRNTFKQLDCSFAGDSDRNDSSPNTSDVIDWGVCGGVNETGPERAHFFKSPGAGTYTVELIGMSADLDLFVIEGASQTMCDPTAACVGSSKTRGNGSEKVTFTAAAGKNYFFVVDGYNGAVSPYTVAVTAGCP